MTHDVLVVQGEGGDQAFPLVRVLEGLGCRVMAVESVEAALAVAGSTPLDLVVVDPDLLDLTVPGADDLDVCRELRGDGFEGGLLVVAGGCASTPLLVG